MMILSAAGLASKWGFNDGDMPDEVWDELGDDLVHAVNWHEALRVLVRRHLVPLLPAGTKVYDVETNHNPIRTDDWSDEAAPDVWVEVRIEDIRAVVAQLIDGAA